MTDPMLGSAEQQKAYIEKINEMIQQDVEERRAARIAEFQRTRDSRGVLVGGSATSNALINAIEQG